MQKKVVGIVAGVAAAHAVLAIAMITGGGCHRPQILAPHTYNEGPEFVAPNQLGGAGPENPQTPESIPTVPGGDAQVEPPADTVKPVSVQPPAPVSLEPIAPAASGSVTYKVKKGDTLSLIAYKHGVSTRELAACNNLTGKAMNRITVGQVLNIPEGGVYNAKRVPKKRAPVKKSPAKKAADAKPVAAELPSDGIYVVKSGDSLDRIGRRYGVTAAAIAKENNISLKKVLQIGDKLRIPGKAAAVSTDKTAAATDLTDTSAFGNLDPNADLDSNTSAPAATAPEAATAPAAEAPAATVPETTAAPASSGATESLEVSEDTTVDAFCKEHGIPVETLRRLNPNIPADGQLKGGTYLVIPVLPEVSF